MEKKYLYVLIRSMQIQSISLGYTLSPAKFMLAPKGLNQSINKRDYNSTDVYTPEYKDISFGQKLNYVDFIKTLHKIYKNKSLKNIVLSAISEQKNYVGSGFSADVYSIPGVDKYLIRLERKHFSPGSFSKYPIISEPQNELAPNFGQYIATNNHGFFITKKVFGESHSLPNWSEKIKEIENDSSALTHKEAEYILRKITELSEFPQKSFDELSLKIQKLNKHTDCEIDIMNPNNLILNNQLQEINIIDLWYHHSDNGSTAPFNGMDSMINLMLDPLTHNQVYEKLGNNGKEKLINASKKIIQKVFIAAQKTGLTRTKNNATIIYKDFDKNANLTFAVPAYDEFLKLYHDLL